MKQGPFDTILAVRQSEGYPERLREMTVLEDPIGTRLRSRLYEMCQKLVMEGGDYRRMGLHG